MRKISILNQRFSRALQVLGCLGAGVLSLCSTPARAQAPSAQAVAKDPVALVKRAVANELKASNGGTPYRYRLHKLDSGKSTTKEIVETKDGDVARMLEVDGHPLGPVATQNELDRLNNLLAHPEIQEHRHKREQEDNKRADELVRLLPDAFIYTYLGMAQNQQGAPAYRLALKPNPDFNPPDIEASVYAGMEGELWIDQREERMVKLDVHLIADVHFGWGILGKLYKGGTILVEQEDVGNNHWEQNHFKLNLHGKALMVKSIDFVTTEDEDGFEPVPADWGYQNAVKLLLKLNPAQAETGQGGTH
jgi:hypothetical protein